MSEALDNIGKVNSIFNRVFREVRSLYHLGADDYDKLNDILLKIIVNYNPVETLANHHLRDVLKLINGDKLFRDFLCKVYYSFRANVDQESYNQLLNRLSQATTLRFNYTGITEDIIRQHNPSSDNLSVLEGNPLVVVLLMIILEGKVVHEPDQQLRTRRSR